MIRMIIFDMAGTVIDEGNLVYQTLQQAINATGHNFTLEQVLREGAGKEKLHAIKDILKSGLVDDPSAEMIHQNFKSLLTRAYETAVIRPQAGAGALLKMLKSKGIYMALNTGYDSGTAGQLMKKLGWDEGREVDLVVTSSHVKNNRPFPDMIYYAMEKSRVAHANEVIKVGDSCIDIEEGRNAGCLFSIGITTGAHTREQLTMARPDYIIDHLQELEEIVAN